MSLEKRPFGDCSTASQRPPVPRLVTADLDDAGFSQIANSKHRIDGNFPAGMAPNGRFFVLPNGLIYDPFRRRADGGKSIAERTE